MRRQIEPEVLEAWIARLAPVDDLVRPADETPFVAVSNGQNDRQRQNSSKDLIEEPRDISPDLLTELCPEASAFCVEKPASLADVVTQARNLAPMMGIDAACHAAAQARKGPVATALTIWVLLQLQPRIRNLGAYFRAVTTGTRSETFCPWAILDRLARQNGSCPRTIPGCA